MGKVFLIVLIVFFLVILGGLFVVRGVVEEVEKQGLGLSALDQLSGGTDNTNNQTSNDPNDPHAWYDGQDPPPQNDPPANNDGSDVTTKEATEAYQDYIAAYNKLTDLMSQGKGDTPEADQAYADYLEAKENYETIAKQLK